VAELLDPTPLNEVAIEIRVGASQPRTRNYQATSHAIRHRVNLCNVMRALTNLPRINVAARLEEHTSSTHKPAQATLGAGTAESSQPIRADPKRKHVTESAPLW
jgi:hypothetical protein